MDDIIDEALSEKTTKDPIEPPKKKRKTIELATNEKEKPMENESKPGFFSFITSNDSSSLRKDLKRLLMKYPELDLSGQGEIEQLVNDLSDEQVTAIYESAKFQIGMQNPNGNGISFLGITGDMLDWFWGTERLAKDLVEDKELIEMVEDLVPSDLTWLSQPFRIINRIIFHTQSNKIKKKC